MGILIKQPGLSWIVLFENDEHLTRNDQCWGTGNNSLKYSTWTCWVLLKMEKLQNQDSSKLVFPSPFVCKWGLFIIFLSDQRSFLPKKKHNCLQSPLWNLIIYFRREDWGMASHLYGFFNKIMPDWLIKISERIIYKLISVSLVYLFSPLIIICPLNKLSTSPIFSLPCEQEYIILYPTEGLKQSLIFPLCVNKCIYLFS